MTGDFRLAWQELCGRRLQSGVPLSTLTSIRTGGPATWFLDAEDEDELALAWAAAHGMGIPVLILGRGSNLLISDQGFDGLVIHLGAGFSRIRLEGDRLYAQAGVSLKQLAYYAADHHLAGLAFAAGIPGSLGGACLMNAGAYNGQMSEVIHSLRCLTPMGEFLALSLPECAFSYRHSRIMEESLVVLDATLKLIPGKRDALYATMAELQKMRQEKQPLSYPSAGSFFKRPPGYFAGALIEQAGLKGLTVGKAQVSKLHAGFLINLGGATTDDFIALKDEVQRRVMARYGVQLEPEVRIIGEAGS
jgi:UDP-N-acetylmuramate dehydrogenase